MLPGAATHCRGPGQLGATTANGRKQTSVTNNSGALQETAPLLGDASGWSSAARGAYVSGAAYPPAALLRSTGITAVDLASSYPVGYVQLASSGAPTQSVLLGWRGDLPVVGLVSPRLSSIRMFVAAWDIDAGTLEPLATLPTWDVSWGVGL